MDNESIQQANSMVTKDVPKPQRESTSEDYWNVVNAFSIPTNYPETRFSPNRHGVDTIDFEDPAFRSVFDSSDIPTKREMLKANNLEDALNIATRRSIFMDSQKAIEQDGLTTQLLMGAIPAIASPSSLLPLGGVVKGAQIAKAANRMTKVAQVGTAGALTGAAANVIDESLFDLQGMPTNYVGAAAIGAIFGGGIGMIGGALSGPTGNKIANSIVPENDTYTKDLDIDYTYEVKVEDGVIKLQDPAKMEKSFIDRIPFIGNALRSDIHTLLQSDSPLIRAFTLRMSPGTVSSKDAAGNVIPVARAGVDVKREAKGIHNQYVYDLTSAYGEAKQAGFKGTLDEYSNEVHKVYVQAMVDQRNRANAYAKDMSVDIINTNKVAKEAELSKVDEEVSYVMDKGSRKLRDMTEEDIRLIESDKQAEVEYKAKLDEYNAKVQSINTEKDTYINSMLEQYRLEGKSKKELNVLKKELQATVDSTIELPTAPIKPAKKFSGKVKVQQRPKEVREKEKQDIITKYDEATDAAIKEKTNEWYTKDNTTFKGDSTVVKGAEGTRKYFQEMLKKSNEVGIKELQGMNPNRIYMPRAYDYRAIQTGKVSQEVVASEVRAGLVNDIRNRDLTKEQLDEAVAGIVQKLNETAFRVDNLTTSFLSRDLPFSTHLKQQKLYLNEAFMPNILKTDAEELVGAYHYSMSGRQAIQHAFGTDNLHDIMKLIADEHIAKGIMSNTKDLQAMQRTIEDLLGTLRMNPLSNTPEWTFTRNLLSYNSARLGGGFGGNQFIELGSAIMMNGISSLLSGRIFKSLTNTADLLYTQKGQHDDFAKYLINSGFMEEALHTSRINRFADTETGFNSGWLENKLHWINDKLMKYNGMRYFMGVMEDYTGGAIVTQLKQGGVDANRLARWGLSQSDAANLGKKLKEATANDGFNLESLSKKERDQLQLAIGRGIEEIVIQGDSIHLPAWMKAPGPFTKVLTQFMRFPLIAQEVLLRKGMAEEQAQMVAGTFGAITTYIGLKYIREQAAISAGLMHPADAKYDYNKFSDEDYLRVLGEALSYTAPLGFMTSVYNYGAIATGNNELGREWSSKNGMSSLLGPSGGLGEDIIQIIRAGVEGNITDERTLQRFKSLTPFMNLPLINEGGKYLAEEYGD